MSLVCKIQFLSTIKTFRCGDDFDGCIIFDECHKAKNLCPSGAGKPTKTGQVMVLHLIKRSSNVLSSDCAGTAEQAAQSKSCLCICHRGQRTQTHGLHGQVWVIEFCSKCFTYLPSRLGIWGPGSPFRDFNDFLGAVEKRGVGAMEIVAMDMKLRGMYIARYQLQSCVNHCLVTDLFSLSGNLVSKE